MVCRIVPIVVPPVTSSLIPQGVPAIALSLDSHSARAEEDYTMGAAISVSIVKVCGGLECHSHAKKTLRDPNWLDTGLAEEPCLENASIQCRRVWFRCKRGSIFKVKVPKAS